MIVTHDAFSPGDSCPNCQDGTLYRLKEWGMNIRLQSAAGIPLPISVQCELIQRALERGHYLTAVQRHEEQVKAEPACWLPWNYQEQLAE